MNSNINLTEDEKDCLQELMNVEKMKQILEKINKLEN